MTELKEVLDKLDLWAGELRHYDKCAAKDIEDVVEQVRKDELDSARERAA